MAVPFDYHLAAYVCSHIFADVTPILLVSRPEGDWCFLCGQEHGEEEHYSLVGVGHLLERDPSLRELADLEPDWEAERGAKDEPWLRTRVLEDE